MKKIKLELYKLSLKIITLDKKAAAVFISFPILQTLSWYFTSKKFFRENFYDDLRNYPNVELAENFFWFTGDFIIYFVLPVLIINFIIKEPLSNFGLTLGDYKTGLKFTFLFLLVMLPILWIASASEEFVKHYPLVSSAKYSWMTFFLYQSALLIFIIAWEFIFRGFILFGLKNKFGYYAVFVQMIPFVMLHNGKPIAETFGAILGGLALGVLAYRTSSIIYCVITHAGVMFIIDFFASLRFRAEDFGIGPKSILNVLNQFF